MSQISLMPVDQAVLEGSPTPGLLSYISQKISLFAYARLAQILQRMKNCFLLINWDTFFNWDKEQWVSFSSAKKKKNLETI